MYNIKDVVYEVKQAARRRIKLLVTIPILFTGISIGAVYMIAPQYKSSTSILVQKDETLNPLVLYEIAVNTVSEDRLQSFNEIIYSRSTMEMLIDSLGLDAEVRTEMEKQQLIETLKKNIGTSFKASDSFQISYFDIDPVRARDGVELLASHFIKTRLRLENRRNNETVNFFSDKLVEMEKVVEQQRKIAESEQSTRMREIPVETEALQLQLQTLDENIEMQSWEVYEEEQKRNIIADFVEAGSRAEDISMLYKLPLMSLPFGEELGELLNQYDQLSQQYTEDYPQLKVLSGQIKQTVERILPAQELIVEDLNKQEEGLHRQRNQLMDQMQQSFIATKRANTQQSDFSIYEGLLAEIKVKLEQAKMTRDIGDRAAEQFIVLDAPYIPEKPAKPNKRLVVGIGFLLGLVVAVALSSLAEVMDTTIRTENDLPIHKPVVAYLTHG